MKEFEYALPDCLIAQDPLTRRDESRLMVVRRGTGNLEHRRFGDIVGYLRPGDVLVLNDTRVIPARLLGVKEGTGGQVEVLLIKKIEDCLWEAMVRPGRRILPGATLLFGEGALRGTVIKSTAGGGRLVRFECGEPFNEVLNRVGRMPLPPYIKKYPADPQRYQTVYARKEGSVAAPTAGLHFTGELLDRIRDAGVRVLTVLLHVGPGTFRPVTASDVEDHHMHEEYYEISRETADELNEAARDQGRRIVAVGTTTVRCLESAAGPQGRVRAGSGNTGIFIYPGYNFRVIDGLVTNFHLPRSTLIMLVSAFAGREKILGAYREAVEREYRFFSFGDAMLII